MYLPLNERRLYGSHITFPICITNDQVVRKERSYGSLQRDRRQPRDNYVYVPIVVRRGKFSETNVIGRSHLYRGVLTMFYVIT